MPFIARNHEQSCFTSPLPTPYWSAMQSACVSRTVSTDSKQPNSSRSNSSEEEVVEGSKKPTTVDLSDVVAKVRNHLNNPSFGCAKYSQVGDYGFNYIPIRERLREQSRTKFDHDTDRYDDHSDIRKYSEPPSSRQLKYILMQNGNALHSCHTKTKSFTEDMPTVHVPPLDTADAFNRLSSNTESTPSYDVNMGHPVGRSCLEGFTFRVWCAISAAIGWILATCAGGTPTPTTERKWNGAGLLETFL